MKTATKKHSNVLVIFSAIIIAINIIVGLIKEYYAAVIGLIILMSLAAGIVFLVRRKFYRAYAELYPEEADEIYDYECSKCGAGVFNDDETCPKCGEKFGVLDV